MEAINIKFNKKLEDMRIVNILLALIVIVMPYIITSGYNSVFRDGKVIFIYTIGLVILSILVINKSTIKYTQQKLALLFLLLIFINTIFAEDKSIALLGNINRDEGFIMIFMYIILYMATVFYFKFNKTILYLSIIAADIMAIYGIIQFAGFDIVREIFSFENMPKQAIGFIGNRNFFSTYLLIFIFISCGAYVFYKKRVFLLMSIPLFASLLCTLTRGGWLGFIAFSIAGAVFIIKRKDCLKRSMILIATFLSVFIIFNIITDGVILNRGKTIVSDTVNLTEDSGSGRLRIWKMGLKIIKTNPLIGSGPDSFEIISQEVCPEDALAFIIRSNSIVDKAHNELIEYGVMGGIPTLTVYCLFILSILRGLWRNKSNDMAKIAIIFIIGYMVQSLFNISVIMVAPIFWIMLGIATKLANGEEYNVEEA